MVGGERRETEWWCAAAAIRGGGAGGRGGRRRGESHSFSQASFSRPPVRWALSSGFVPPCLSRNLMHVARSAAMGFYRAPAQILSSFCVAEGKNKAGEVAPAGWSCKRKRRARKLNRAKGTRSGRRSGTPPLFSLNRKSCCVASSKIGIDGQAGGSVGESSAEQSAMAWRNDARSNTFAYKKTVQPVLSTTKMRVRACGRPSYYYPAEGVEGKIWKERRDLVVSTIREDTDRCREEVCVLGRSAFNVDRAHSDCQGEGTAQDLVVERRGCLR